MNKWDYLFIFSWTLALGIAFFTLTRLWYAEQALMECIEKAEPIQQLGPALLL